MIYAKVVLEGGFEPDHRGTGTEITCIRNLLDEVSKIYSAEFQSAFGTSAVDELLVGWRENGLEGRQVSIWVDKLRKAAFEGDDLGEASVEFRNKDLPDIAPGVVPVVCAILDYLAGCCGTDGYVRLT